MPKLTPPRALILVAAVLTPLLIWPAAPALVAAEAPTDGKAIFLAQKCDLCHNVSGAGIAAATKSDKLKGPDLAGYVAKDPAATAAFLRLQGELAGARHKKEFKGGEAELKAVLDWLAQQKPAAPGP